MENPSDFIESGKYFSWEVFFTKLLVEETKDTPLSYKKKDLNQAYLAPKNRKTIVDTVNETAGDVVV